jgi:hypothetical protein
VDVSKDINNENTDLEVSPTPNKNIEETSTRKRKLFVSPKRHFKKKHRMIREYLRPTTYLGICQILLRTSVSLLGNMWLLNYKNSIIKFAPWLCT